jgi:glycosyltransferase 2 family protein
MTIPRILLRLAFAAVICLAAFLLYRTLSRYSPSEIIQSLGSIPAARLVAAVGFAACSYLCLTGFDWLAVRYAGKPLRYRRTALASFTALSIGHNIGVAALSSGAVRYRFYSRWGLGAGDVAKVIVFCGVTVGIGLATLGGAGLLLYPAEAEGLLGLDDGAILVLALACLAAPAVYVALAAFVRKPLRFRKWALELPRLPLAIGQVVVGTANFACVAACLHQLLAAFTEAGYLKVASIYVIANTAALMSHVPGGLGVLEATVAYLLPDAAAIGALIAFRAVYFFLPLSIGLPAFLVSEHVLRK